jgi:hypothetical protein
MNIPGFTAEQSIRPVNRELFRTGGYRPGNLNSCLRIRRVF